MIVINAEYKIKNAINWIEALLSGEYPKGQGVLGDAETGYCCWGLGCFIVGINTCVYSIAVWMNVRKVHLIYQMRTDGQWTNG